MNCISNYYIEDYRALWSARNCCFKAFVIEKNILFCFRYVFHHVLQMCAILRLTAFIGLSYKEVINFYPLRICLLYRSFLNMFLTEILESDFISLSLTKVMIARSLIDCGEWTPRVRITTRKWVQQTVLMAISLMSLIFRWKCRAVNNSRATIFEDKDDFPWIVLKTQANNRIYIMIDITNWRMISKYSKCDVISWCTWLL